MSGPQARRRLVLAAAALLAAGLLAGALATALAAPLAAGLGLLALRRGRGEPPAFAGSLVAGGAAALGLAVGTAVAGAFAAALLAAGAGVALLQAAGRVALAAHVPPEGVSPVSPGPVRATLAVSADEAMKWTWYVTSLVSPPPAPAEIAAAVARVLERQREAGWLEDPARAHPRPPALEKVELTRTSLAGGAEWLRFESGFEPADPDTRAAYPDLPGNRTGHAWWLRHSGPPRPVLLCVHGYGMGRPTLDARAFDARRLYREVGIDVLGVTLPLHGLRSLGRRSGAGFLDGHPLATNAAFAHAIWDLRRLSGWLRSQGVPALGVLGQSLGGYTAAVYASLEDGLACAVPWIPAVSLAALLVAGRSAEERAARDAAGLGETQLAELFAPHDPLRHRPRVAPAGRLLLAGTLDRICPPAQALALHAHWGAPPIHWFPGSHLVPLGRRALNERLDAHLRATLLAPAAPPLPLTRFRGAAQAE